MSELLERLHAATSNYRYTDSFAASLTADAAGEIRTLAEQVASLAAQVETLRRERDQAIAALRTLVNRGAIRWRGTGYESYACTSCGAQMQMWFGESGIRQKAEPCSPTCPWGVAEQIPGVSGG